MITQVLCPAKLGDFIQASAMIRSLAGPEGDGIQLLALDPTVLEAQRLLFPKAEGILLYPRELGIGDGGKDAGVGVTGPWDGGQAPGDGGSQAGTGDRPFTGVASRAEPGQPGPARPARRADLLVNLSVDARAVRYAASLGPKEILGPRPEGDGVWIPPAQRLAMAAMALDRRLGRLNITDVWRSLRPESPADLAVPPAWPKLGGEPKDALKGTEKLPLVSFHLGARGPMRRWPVESHARLAAELFGLMPFHAAVLGSRSERSMALRFAKELKELEPNAPPAVILSGMTSLSDLWVLLSISDFLVSSDTGVMHLAAAVGISQLAVFAGPAYAHETGPYNRLALVVQGLAPCGPCVEGKGCTRKTCRAMPHPHCALPAAAELIGEDDQDRIQAQSGNGAADQNARVEFWETGIDRAGAYLAPWGERRAELDHTSLAALLFREGTRAVAGLYGPAGGDRSGTAASVFKKASETVSKEIALYKINDSIDKAKVRSYLAHIEKKALEGKDRLIFREVWEGLLAEFILRFAL